MSEEEKKLNDLVDTLTDSSKKLEKDLVDLDFFSLSHKIHEMKLYQMELETQNEELKQTHLLLEESKARFFELYEEAPVGYFTLYQNGSFQEINQTAANMLGETKEILLKESFFKYIAPEFKDTFYFHTEKLFETATPQVCKVKILKNNIPIWIKLEARIAYSIDKFPMYRATMSDISESKLLEEELLKTNIKLNAKIKELNTEQEIFDLFLENSPILIYFMDEHRKILRMSKNFESYLGLPLDKIIGKTVDKIFSSGTSKETIENDFKKLQKGEKISFEEDFKGKKFSTLKFPIYIDEKVRFIAVLTSDISNKTIMEKELRLAKIAAEEQTKVKENFLTNMSHEIRTPLNGIIGLIQLMNFTKMNKKQKHYIFTIEKESYILLSLLNNILDYSKLKYSIQSFNNTNVNIRETMQDIRVFFMTGININVDIFFHVEENVPEIILCDEIKLKEILINLLGNAIKFTKNGYILVKVYGDYNKLKDTSEHRTFFSIEDTGIGMPEKFISHLFENFVQADESISRRYGGTGLGLAITKELVELLGGRIVVKSKENKGTFFSFDIKTNILEQHKVRKYNTEILLINKNKNSLDRFVEMVQSVNNGNCYSLSCIKEVVDKIKDLSLAKKTSFVVFIFENIFDDSESEENQLKLLENYRENVVLIKRIENQNNNLFHSIDLPIDQEEISQILHSIECGIVFEDKFKSNNKVLTFIENKTQIMVIEDNRTNMEVLKEMFKSIKCKADYFKDGLSAINRMSEKKYDIIFTDIQLPDFSGFDILNVIRQLDKEKGIHTVVVAVTAHILDEYEEKCLEAGMDEYISKPIILSKLCDIIEKYSKPSEPLVKIRDIKSEELCIIKKIEYMAFEDGKISLDKMVVYLENKDYVSVKKEAHKLKGSFATIKRNHIASMALEIFNTTKKENHERTSELINAIKKEVLAYENTCN